MASVSPHTISPVPQASPSLAHHNHHTRELSPPSPQSIPPPSPILPPTTILHHPNLHHAPQPHSAALKSPNSTTSSNGEIEEINTKELAQRISAELKRYSIPQAIFAQRVLCRSQGTLSDLLRNPKPWSKLKSGRETFRRMFKWLQEPEFQRMSALRLAVMQQSAAEKDRGRSGVDSLEGKSREVQKVLGPSAACKRKDVMEAAEQASAPKKPRLVFTDLQRRTLQAIFKETKRPSKEMQVTIARQLGLEPTTVGNFFMNARRRSVDKWKDDKADLSFDFDDDMGEEPRDPSPEPPMTPMGSSGAGSQQASRYYQDHIGSVIKASTPNHNAVLVTSANPAAVVQHLQQPQDTMTPT